MKKFRIYQLPVEHAAKFMSLDFVKENSIMLKLEDYKLVYEGEFEPQGKYPEPDQLYMKFQGEKPEGYTGHSISMSDVVEIDGKYFYCDDYGWEEVDFEEPKTKKAYIVKAYNSVTYVAKYNTREEALAKANELNDDYYQHKIWNVEEIEDETKKEEEAKRYGTTVESLEEQGFIFMEEACGDCHWFASCAELGGTLMSLAWYREQQKNFRNEHFKKNE